MRADLTAFEKDFASDEKPLEFDKNGETLKNTIVSAKKIPGIQMNDESEHNQETRGAGESVQESGQGDRRKPKIPAFLFKPVSETAGDIAVEIRRRREKRGW